jgi:hypothetical protein
MRSLIHRHVFQRAKKSWRTITNLLMAGRGSTIDLKKS